MARLPLILSVAVLALALVVAAGCGGGDEEVAEETVPRLSKGQLIHKMGLICQEHSDLQVVKREAFEKKHNLPRASLGKASGHQLEQELTIVILPIVRDTIHDLSQLRPPQRQEAVYKEFIEALEYGVSYSEKDPSWVGEGPGEPFSPARILSGRLGTSLCGQA